MDDQGGTWRHAEHGVLVMDDNKEPLTDEWIWDVLKTNPHIAKWTPDFVFYMRGDKQPALPNVRRRRHA